MFLQFKRPLRYAHSRPKKFPYWFEVRSGQHRTLLELAERYPGAASYAFPLIGDHQELIDAAPNLTDETFFAPVETARHLDDPPAEHEVEVYPDRAIFHSEPVPVPRRSLREVVESMRQHRLTLNQFIRDHRELRERAAIFAGLARNGSRIVEFEMPRALFAPLDEINSIRRRP
jgi:hypothetical protein